jgi:REP element-mobilizing transposase RayT
MPDKFKNRYRISSARLSSWDYSSNGAYFITICTKNREHYFGEIIDTKMKLSQIGVFANTCWINVPNHFPHFHLDEFIVMPNHIHGIVMIENPYIDNNSIPRMIETKHALLQHKTDIHEIGERPKHHRYQNQGKNTISSMVGSFKSAISKYSNENKIHFGWQTRFHDHIIRDVDEFYTIRNYIINNPLKWNDDKFYSE